MRFTGQVRVPEVDHPGIPATFLVEEGQAEVLLEGESLGRWSLFDVHASRLVSAAFSVSLDGDEITFIADEPVDFAYKGVDHMAEVWARYKAMTMPRRMMAVSRSRRGTRPSRIAELRQAMLANLEVYANSAGDPDVAEVEELEPRDRLTVVPPFVSRVVEPALPEEPIARPDPVPEKQPLRPGPGLVSRRPAFEEVADLDPVHVFQAEPEPEPVADMGPELEPEPVAELEPIAELEPVAELEPEPVPEPVPVAELEPEPEPVPVAESEPEPEPVPVAEIPALTAPRRLVVDLGAYEQVTAPTTLAPPREPALALTTPVAEDKAGLLGAVRAAFVRNKGAHEHEFVEAPGGIGIIRHICNECGYISIGVHETDAG